MYLQQMFPKASLDAADLKATFPNGVIVTIESVDAKTFEAKNPGEAEIGYYLKVREFKKPFKLNKSNAMAIADLLGSQNTDDWFGKTINLRAIDYRITDRQSGQKKIIAIFDVDMLLPTSPPHLQPNRDITGAFAMLQSPTALPQNAAFAPKHDFTFLPPTSDRIGIDKAVEMVAAFNERDRTTPDFVKHLESLGLEDLVRGKETPDWPSLILAMARKWVRDVPVTLKIGAEEKALIRAKWEPPAPKPGWGDVIDTVTGEVIDDDSVPF